MRKEYGYFEYTVQYFDEEGDNHEKHTAHGVIFANSYSGAVKNLERYYGLGLDSIVMTALEPLSVYEFEDGGCLFNIKVENKNGERQIC